MKGGGRVERENKEDKKGGFLCAHSPSTLKLVSLHNVQEVFELFKCRHVTLFSKFQLELGHIVKFISVMWSTSWV